MVLSPCYNFHPHRQSKVSLTTDMWTSEHSNKPYTCLTAHFVDDTCVLHKKILAFKLLDCPYDCAHLFGFMKDMMLGWNLDRKVSCIVLDNASANTSMIHDVKNWLMRDSVLSFNGDLLHFRCSAHILNLIVRLDW